MISNIWHNSKKCRTCKYVNYIITHDRCYNAGDWYCQFDADIFCSVMAKCRDKNPVGLCAEHRFKWYLKIIRRLFNELHNERTD